MIQEKNGVSDTVSQQAKTLVNKVNLLIINNLEKFNKNSFNYIKEDGTICVVSFSYSNFLLKNVYGLDELQITVYNFNNAEDYNVFVRNVSFFDSCYDYIKNTISIVCASIQGKVFEPLLYRLLEHELRHKYNTEKKGELNIPKLYTLSVNILNNKSIDPQNINYKIANMLYWLYNDEIYANCQSLNAEIKTLKLKTLDDVIKKSSVYAELKEIKIMYQNIMNNKKGYVERLFYNTKIEDMLQYIKTQILYTEKKFGRVIAYSLENNRNLQEKFVIRNCKKALW